MKSIDIFLQNYIGTDYSKCDCWDIVVLFYKEIFEIDLNFVDYYGTPSDDNDYRSKVYSIINLHKSKFKRVDTPEIGDIIVFNIFGITAHVGIYIGNKRFMHSIKEIGCVVETLQSRWGNKVEGYYRWPELD